MAPSQTSAFGASGNVAEVLEAIHRIDLDTCDWLAEVCRALTPLVPWGHGIFGGTGSGVVGRSGLEMHCVAGDAKLGELARGTSHTADLEHIELMTRRAGRVILLSDAYAGAKPSGIGAVLAAGEWGDGLMMTGIDIDGPILDYVGFTAPSGATIELSLADRDGWNATAAHVAAAWRLRRRLAKGEAGAPCEAVLTPSGACSHAEGSARDPGARDALGRAVRAIERARASDRRTDDHALLGAWQALYEGRWTLVEQLESDGRRVILARVNEPRRAARPELSTREQEIAHLLSAGVAQKAIAYELGLAPSTVAFHVRSIAAKLGARSTADAVRKLSAPG